MNRELQILKTLNRILASAVNLLKKTTTTSPKTRGDILQITLPENHEKTLQKCSHGDFASIWNAYTCWLSKRVLEPRLLESGLNKIFTVCNFGNILAMTIILFSKLFKIWRRFQKWNKKLTKDFLLANSRNLEEDTWHLQSIC